jgi:predicted DNA-binding antitoxin AbrB/MazE fold protein
VSQIIEAVFDGTVLRPEEPLKLEEGTRVRITIEVVPPGEANRPSFLRVARSLQLEGPPDWSANLDHYLYDQDVKQDD